MKKDLVYNTLIATGRKLVEDNGPDFLTARKLSDASGHSVGAIYNIFSNMDNFVIAQNIYTLSDLNDRFEKIVCDPNPYKNLNCYLDCFVDYVLDNQNLWFLLYNFHLNNKSRRLPPEYLRQAAKITKILNRDFNLSFKGLSTKEQKLSIKVLWLSIFAVSAFLATQALDNFRLVNKKTIAKLLLNTYLAGLNSLKNRK